MIAVIFLAVLIVWEALYIAGFIDPVRYYHPIGALQILSDLNFLRGFGLMSVQLVVASLAGGTIALAVGPLILRRGWLVGSTIRFLRIAMWIPFIIYWPLPIWGSWKLDFGQTILVVLLCSVLVVGFSSVHSYLVSRLLLNLTPKDGRWWLLRSAIVQALFISVYSQLWLEPYGWDWYTYRVAGAYAASMLVLLLVFIIERLLRSRFDYISAIRGNILLGQFDLATVGTLFGSMVIALFLTLIWQVLSLSPLESVFSSPLAVLGVYYHLLFKGSFWQDVYVSFSEIFGGLILGSGATLILYRMLYAYNSLRARLCSLLTLLHITFFFSPVIIMQWLAVIGYWQKTIGIGLVTIYPILEALWGLRDRAWGLRLLLAIDNALPYAVVMMLFSEAMAATGGLGFSMVVAHAEKQTVPEGIAVAVILVALLVVVSGVTRALAKHIYQVTPTTREGLGRL